MPFGLYQIRRQLNWVYRYLLVSDSDVVIVHSWL